MCPPKLALACALLLTSVSSPAAAREIELSWVATGTTPPDAYVAEVRTLDGALALEIELGYPASDADGVHTVRLPGVPSDGVRVRLRARTNGSESAPSNEIHVPAELPRYEAISLFVVDGRRHPLVDAATSRVDAIAGVPQVAVARVDGRGALTGAAASDLDGDGLYETASSLSGLVWGRNGSVLRILELGTGAPGTSLRTRYEMALHGPAGVASEARTAEGELDGAPVRSGDEETTTLLPHDHAWMVTFHIDDRASATEKPAEGSLVLASGRTIAVAGHARRRGGAWSVLLRSGGADAGVTLRLDELELTTARRIVSGRMRYSALGQHGELDLGSLL